MNVRELREWLNNNPAYAELSFAAQQQVWGKYLGEMLPRDDQFLALSPEARQQAFQLLLRQPPVLKDKALEAQVAQTTQAALGGDPKAQKQISSAILTHSFQTNNSIAAAAVALLDPVLRAVTYRPEEVPYQEMAGNLRDPEMNKVMEYWNYLMDDGLQVARSGRFYQGLGATLGIGADIAFTLALVGVGPQSPKVMATPARLVYKAIERQAQSGFTRALAPLLGETIHAGLTGSIWAIQQTALDVAERLTVEPRFGEIMHTLGKHGMTGFVGDWTWNMILGIGIPTIWNLGKAARGAFGGGPMGPPVGSKKWLKRFNEQPPEAQLHYFEQAAAGMTETVNPELLRQQPLSTQRVYAAGKHAAETFNNVEVKSPDDVYRALAFAKGYGVEAEGDLWRVFKTASAEKVTSWMKPQDARKWVARDMAEVVNTAKTSRFFGAVAGHYGEKAGNVRMRTFFTGLLPRGAEHNVEVLTRMAAPKNGRFLPNRMRDFSKAYLMAGGASRESVEAVGVVATKEGLQISVAGRKIAEFPSMVEKPSQELERLRSLVEGLQPLLGREGAKELGEAWLSKYPAQLEKARVYSPAWIPWVLKERLQIPFEELADGTFKAGKDIYGSLDEVGDYAMGLALQADPIAFRHYVESFQGGKVKMLEDGGFEIISGYGPKNKMEKFSTVEEALRSHPEWKPPVPGWMGPEFAIVDNNALKVTYEGDSAIGSLRLLLEELSRFGTHRPGLDLVSTVIGQDGTVLMVDRLTRQVTVDIPKIAHAKHFSNLSAAQRWMRTGFKDYQELQRVAHSKGMRLDVAGGEFVAYTNEGAVTARDLKGLFEVLRSVPTPSYISDLAKVPDSIYDALPKPQDPAYRFDQWPVQYSHIGRTRDWLNDTLSSLEGYTRAPLNHVAEQVRLKKAPKELYDLMKNVDTPFKTIMRAEENRLTKLFHMAFTDSKGKPLRTGRRVLVGKYLQEADPVKREATKKLLELSDDEVFVGSKLHAMWGESHEKGIAAYAQISEADFLQHYMPKMHATWARDTSKSFTNLRTDDLVRHLYGPSAPPQLIKFFEHMRAADVVNFVAEEDPLELLRRYTSVVLRTKYVGEAWHKLATYLNKNIGSLDKDLKNVVIDWMHELMGIPTGGEAAWKSFTRKSQEALSRGVSKLTGKEVHFGIQDYQEFAMGMGYYSGLSWRGYPAVRNIFDLYMMVAPRLGQEAVITAQKEIAKDSTGRIFQILREKGQLIESMPLFKGEVFESMGWRNVVGKVGRAGMRFFKEVDDLTRATAYLASEIAFDKQAGKLTRLVERYGTEEGLRRFDDLTGIWATKIPDKGKIHDFLMKGDYAAAKDAFATATATETVPMFRGGDNPRMFRGAWGKMLGMFGHYPVAYLGNFMQSMGQASRGQKMVYAMRLAANAAVLTEVSREVLGIDSDDFLPWSSALFSGGPFFHMTASALMSLQPGYRGRQARAELYGLRVKDGKPYIDLGKSEILKWVLPFQFVARDLQDAAELFNKGEYVWAFKAAFSAPVNPAMLE